MRIISFLLLLAICWIFPADLNAAGSVRVRGYTRKDGTYVAPHYRSAPDGNFYNNWSTKGNINPYTGKEGTRVTPPPGSGGYVPSPPRFDTESYAPTFSLKTLPSRIDSQAVRNQERAAYWKERGYNFDPSFMSSYAMDQKVKDIDRSNFWKERGYAFDSRFMTSYAMDQKVKDIERSKFWKDKGHTFDPNIMTSYAMDQKVKDIERSAYWREKGYSFNPDYMSSYAMDQKAKDIERSKFWKQRGYDFNPNYMTAYAMDREAEKMQRQKPVATVPAKLVDVTGIGEIEFPGGMSDAEIKGVLDRELPRLRKEISEKAKLRK